MASDKNNENEDYLNIPKYDSDIENDDLNEKITSNTNEDNNLDDIVKENEKIFEEPEYNIDPNPKNYDSNMPDEIELGDVEDTYVPTTPEELENKLSTIELPDKTNEEFQPNSEIPDSDLENKSYTPKPNASEEQLELDFEDETSRAIVKYNNTQEEKKESALTSIINSYKNSKIAKIVTAGIAGAAIIGALTYGVIKSEYFNKAQPETTTIQEPAETLEDLTQDSTPQQDSTSREFEAPDVTIEEPGRIYTPNDTSSRDTTAQRDYTTQEQTQQRPEVQQETDTSLFAQTEQRQEVQRETDTSLFAQTEQRQEVQRETDTSLFAQTQQRQEVQQETDTSLFAQPEQRQEVQQETDTSLFAQKTPTLVERLGDISEMEITNDSFEDRALTDFESLFNIRPQNMYNIEDLITDNYRNAQGVSTINFNSEIINEEYNIKEALVYLDGNLVGYSENVIGTALTYDAGQNPHARIEVAAILEKDNEVGMVTYQNDTATQTIENYIQTQIQEDLIEVNTDISVVNLSVDYISQEGNRIPNIYQGKSSDGINIPTNLFGPGTYEITGLDRNGNDLETISVEYQTSQEEEINNFFD